MPRPANTIERITAAHVEIIPDGCWQWRGKIALNGYGHADASARYYKRQGE